MPYHRLPTGPVGWIISGVIFLAAIIGYFVLDGYEEQMLEEQLRAEAENHEPIWVDETTDVEESTTVVGNKGGEVIHPTGGGYMTLNEYTFSPGDEMVLSCRRDDSFSNSAWVGIIPSDVPHGDESVNDQHDIDYEYIVESGEFAFAAPSEPGDYDFRLHSSDGGGIEVDSISFTVR